MATRDVKRWLDTLQPGSSVAINDGGILLVEVDENNEQTGAWLEVGGTPDPDEDPT